MMGIPAPPFIQVGTIGFDDSLILLVLALVVFGPRRLPEIGRQIGKLMYEFRKASNDFKFQMEEELRLAEEADRRKQEEERQRQLAQQTQEPVPADAADQAQYALPATSETTGFEESYTGRSYPYDGYGGSYDEPEEQVTRSEETELRVQPPATGEPVAAERPGSVRKEASMAQEPALAGGEATDLATSDGSGMEATGTGVTGAEESPEGKESTAAVAGAVTKPAGPHG